MGLSANKNHPISCYCLSFLNWNWFFTSSQLLTLPLRKFRIEIKKKILHDKKKWMKWAEGMLQVKNLSRFAFHFYFVLHWCKLILYNSLIIYTTRQYCWRCKGIFHWLQLKNQESSGFVYLEYDMTFSNTQQLNYFQMYLSSAVSCYGCNVLKLFLQPLWYCITVIKCKKQWRASKSWEFSFFAYIFTHHFLSYQKHIQ